MKRKLYFGWVVTIGVFICAGITTYLSSNCFSLFVTSVSEGLQLSISAVMTGATMMALGGALGALVCGRLVDRRGLRQTTVLSVLGVVIGYVILGFTSSLPIFYIGNAIIGFSAQSVAQVLINTMAVKWFDKYRGVANGICGAGSGVAACIMSPIVANLISGFGFNRSYLILAAATFVICIPAALICIRNDPRDMGLMPDGATVEQKHTEKVVEAVGLTSREALRTANFWLIATAYFVFSFCSLGIVQTFSASFESIGFSPMAAALAVSVFGIACIPGRIVSGALLDKIPHKIMTVLIFGFVIAACILMSVLKSGENAFLMYLFAVLFAIGNVSAFPLMMKYISTCLGDKHFGEISGIIFTAMGISGMFGPSFVGIMYDLTNAYTMAYVVFGIVTAAAAVLLLMTKQKKLATMRG